MLKMLHKLKKKPIIITLIIVVITLLLIGFAKNLNSTSSKLQKKGYSKLEVQELINLNIRIDDILNIEYSKDIPYILKEKYYIDDNFYEYINYKKENPDISYSDIVALVNTNAYKGFYEVEYDIDLNNLILVNKFYKLKNDYVPINLVDVSYYHCFGEWKMDSEAYDSFIKMFNDANKLGYTIIINQAYRSYENQKYSYDSSDDNYAARPGHSEHQTGLAVDVITYKEDSFDVVSGDEFLNTNTYSWMLNNAYKYGFILRYPKDKEHITGYKYEPWHFRYVGFSIASIIHSEGITLDEYYAYYINNKTVSEN
ncbi:MAG: M15 family metallopeptidase [Bacilli bacterium]|nr:M15 family metallopeptidase [Bacilli bacterium]